MNGTRFDVVCLGILVADVVVSGIDGLPPPGAISPVSGLSLTLGGCAVNTAVCLARLGLRVAVAGKLGDDPLGHFMLDALTAEGVNVEGVRISPGTATGAAVACVRPGGERGFWSLLGANGGLRPADIDPDLVCAARILHVAGSPFLKGFNGAPCASVMRLARSRGVLTSLDTIHYGAGFRELVEPEMRETDLLLPSYDEAKALSGETAPGATAGVRGLETLLAQAAASYGGQPSSPRPGALAP